MRYISDPITVRYETCFPLMFISRMVQLSSGLDVDSWELCAMGVHAGLQVDMPMRSRMVHAYWDCDREMVRSFRSRFTSIRRMNFATPRSRILNAVESLSFMEFMNIRVVAARRRSSTYTTRKQICPSFQNT